MDWDYRIIKDTDGDLKIRQVYYKEDGSIYGMSEDDLAIEGSSVDELVYEYKLLKKAFDRPVIELSKKKLGSSKMIKEERITFPNTLPNYITNLHVSE